jgi:hypothetical protein
VERAERRRYVAMALGLIVVGDVEEAASVLREYLHDH